MEGLTTIPPEKQLNKLNNMRFKFKVLWLENSLGLAVSQKNGIPLTNYYFWPRNDTWEHIKFEIDSRPWISPSEKVLLLNNLTEILNNWKKPEGASYKEVHTIKNGELVSIA